MRIHGFIGSTLIDYPGKIASICFTPGCNFRCPYCHNGTILVDDGTPSKEQEFLDHLKKKKKWIEGIVITGGEPTLHAGLIEFVSKVKELGLLVKLDTNGTNPKIVEELLDKVDYFAMDIKAPKEKYSGVVGVNVDLNAIQKSIDLIKTSKDYEFRTTIVPRLLNKEDVLKIGNWLDGSKAYYLQQFQPENAMDKSFRTEKSYRPKELTEMCDSVAKHFQVCGVRGI